MLEAQRQQCQQSDSADDDHTIGEDTRAAPCEKVLANEGQQRRQCDHREVRPGPGRQAQAMRMMHKHERQQHHRQWHAGDEDDNRGIEQQTARERVQRLGHAQIVKVLEIDQKQPDARQAEYQQVEAQNGQDAAMRFLHEFLENRPNWAKII
jgi:hypothetical protein